MILQTQLSRKLLSFLLCILIITNGCRELEKDKVLLYFSEFPTNDSLSNNEIKTPPVNFAVMGMEVVNNTLITVDLKSDTIFHFYNLPDFSFLGGYITRGEGPEDEIMVYPYIHKISNNNFYYQTLSSIKKASFNKASKEFLIEKVINLPGELINYYPTLLFDSLIIGCDMNSFSRYEYKIYNTISKETYETGPEFPVFNQEIPLKKLKVVFAKILCAKPDNKLFAAVYDKFPILRIYSKDSRLIKEIHYENGQVFPIGLLLKYPSNEEILSITQNYRMVKTTDKYIYALYIGKTNDELGENAIGINNFSNIIHIWDWDGNPVKKIVLDKFIFTFCVTLDDKLLIASSVNNLNSLYIYELKNN